MSAIRNSISNLVALHAGTGGSAWWAGVTGHSFAVLPEWFPARLLLGIKFTKRILDLASMPPQTQRHLLTMVTRKASRRL